MVEQRHYSPAEVNAINTWVCLNCGNAVDSMILQNRARLPPTEKGKPGPRHSTCNRTRYY